MTVTGLYAGLAAALLVALTLRVVALRRRLRVGIGTGQQAQLERAIRVHGNFIEYTPLALLLLALYEAGGANPVLVHGAGALLIVSRLLHAWGLAGSAGTSPGRFLGTAGTLFVLLCLGIRLVLRALGSG